MTTDPRFIAAQQRYVAETADDETPDAAFARRAVAAYEMYLFQAGREIPKQVSFPDAMGAYGLLTLRSAA